MKRVVALSLMVFLAVLLSACAGRENTDQSIVSQNSETTREEQETISQENFFQESEGSGDVAQSAAKLLYMGQASIRITTAEGKVIYIDPYVGDGYEPAADLILVTHSHYDHNGVDKVEHRNADCQIITWKEIGRAHV